MTAHSPIDTYALYGEPIRDVELNFLHVEPIRVRSGRFDWTISPHSHADLHQVLLVTAGGGTMSLEGAVLPIEPPACLIIPSGTVHGFAFTPLTDGWIASIAVGLAADEARSDPAGCAIFARAHSFNAIEPAAAATLGDAFGTLSRELVWSAPGRTLAIRAELLRLMAVVARLTERESETGPLRLADADLTERFRRLIEGCFHRGESVAGYARALGVSEDRLLAACRRRFGTSPIHLVHRRVVLEAQRWLAYTPKSIGEIGRELGFDDPAYFSRFFRRQTAESPRAFRARTVRSDIGRETLIGR